MATLNREIRPKALLFPHLPPLLKMVFPTASVATFALAMVLMVGLMALAAQVRIPLPHTPVPITLQTAVVLTAGGLLGAKWGTLTLTVYVLLGVSGLPFFAGANGGWEYAIGATGGYLLGFIVAAFTTGYIAQRGFLGLNTVWSALLASSNGVPPSGPMSCSTVIQPV